MFSICLEFFGVRLGVTHQLVTKSARAFCVSMVREMVGMTIKGDAKAELKASRIRRDCNDLHKVVEENTVTCDPFTSFSSTSESLYNISTGKAVSDAARKYLLGVPEIGKKRHQDFLQACIDEPKRFEQPISKVKLVTFKDGCIRNKRTVNKKIAELKCHHKPL